MHLDQDLIFRLLQVAEQEAPTLRFSVRGRRRDFKKWNVEEVKEHLEICQEERWLELKDMGVLLRPDWSIERLTAKGHQELKSRKKKPIPSASSIRTIVGVVTVIIVILTWLKCPPPTLPEPGSEPRSLSPADDPPLPPDPRTALGGDLSQPGLCPLEAAPVEVLDRH